MAATGQAERDELDNIPQCESCGVLYRFLPPSTKICGHCSQYTDPKPPTAGPAFDQTIASLTDQAAHHEQSASKHRLNQPNSKQNSALQSASAVKQKVAVLKKQVKSETFAVDVTLWIHPATGKKTARKASLLAQRLVYKMDDCVDYVLDQICQQVKAAYEVSREFLSSPTSLPSFERKDIDLGIQQTGNNVIQLKLVDQDANKTVESWYSELKLARRVTDKDLKAKSLTLRLYVYETSEDTDDENASTKRRHRPDGGLSEASFRTG